MLSVLHAPVRRCVLVLGGAPPVAEGGLACVWDAQAGATSYVLQVGAATTESGVYNSDVGNKLGITLPLSAGTYYWRVVPQGAGSTTVEQVVTLT